MDPATLKKLAIAPSNEGYVVQTLKFLGLIDKGGAQTETGIDLFSTHKDDEFASKLEGIVRSSYATLFDLRGDDAWTLDKGALVAFFRQSDRTSDIVGGRQANAFTTLAALSGKRQADPTRGSRGTNGDTAKPSRVRQTSTKREPQEKALDVSGDGRNRGGTVRREGYGLTVRIEINLPANGSPETYDAIFKSLRSNLLSDEPQ